MGVPSTSSLYKEAGSRLSKETLGKEMPCVQRAIERSARWQLTPGPSSNFLDALASLGVTGKEAQGDEALTADNLRVDNGPSSNFFLLQL